MKIRKCVGPELWFGLLSSTYKKHKKGNGKRWFEPETTTAVFPFSTELRQSQSTFPIHSPDLQLKTGREVARLSPPFTDVETEGTEIVSFIPQIFIKHLPHAEH